MQNEYDLVIIGSGAGGSPIAQETRAQGQECADAGKGSAVPAAVSGTVRRQRFPARRSVLDGHRKDPAPRRGEQGRVVLFKPRRAGPERRAARLSPTPMAATTPPSKATPRRSSAVARSSTAASRCASRRRDMTLAQWNNRPGAALDGDPNDEVRREARDWPFPYATLEPYYAKAEALVGINGEVANQRKPFTSGDQYQKPLAYNPISEHVKTGMDRTRHAALSHAARGHHRRITPRAAARAAAGRGGEDRLRQSLRRSDGVQIHHLGVAAQPDQGPAELHAAAQLHRHPSVVRRRAGQSGALPRRPTARRVRFPARIVIVACSAIETSGCSSCRRRSTRRASAPRINQDGNGCSAPTS